MAASVVILAAVLATVVGFALCVMWKCAYSCGLIDGAERMARQIERDASLKSAARRLDTEWDQTHGQQP